MQACFCLTPFDPHKIHKDRRSVDRHEAQITNLSQSVTNVNVHPRHSFLLYVVTKVQTVIFAVMRGCGATPTCSVSLRRTAHPSFLCCAAYAPPCSVRLLTCAPHGPCAPFDTAAAMPINASSVSSVAGGGRGCPLGAYPSLDGNEAGHPAFVTLDHLSFARRVSVAQESTPPHAGAGDARPRES